MGTISPDKISRIVVATISSTSVNPSCFVRRINIFAVEGTLSVTELAENALEPFDAARLYGLTPRSSIV